MNAVKICGYIAANIIAFVALLAFFNDTLTWFGNRAGLEEDLTFQVLPVAHCWAKFFVTSWICVLCCSTSARTPCIHLLSSWESRGMIVEESQSLSVSRLSSMNLLHTKTSEYLSRQWFTPSSPQPPYPFSSRFHHELMACCLLLIETKKHFTSTLSFTTARLVFTKTTSY